MIAVGYIVLGVSSFFIVDVAEGRGTRQLLQHYVSSLTAQHIHHFLEERASDLRYIAMQEKPPETRVVRKSSKPRTPFFDNHPELPMHQIVESGRYRSRGLFQQPNRGPRGQETVSCPGAAGGFSNEPNKPPVRLQDVGRAHTHTGVPGVLLTRDPGNQSRHSAGFRLCGLLPSNPDRPGLEKEWNRDFDVHLNFSNTHENIEDPYILDYINIFGQNIKLEMKPRIPLGPNRAMTAPSTCWPAGFFW